MGLVVVVLEGLQVRAFVLRLDDIVKALVLALKAFHVGGPYGVVGDVEFAGDELLSGSA